MTKSEQTRERILVEAEKIILKKGFSGTSIDEILIEAEITKGGFFYHFSSKADLAKHLILKYIETDGQFFNRLHSRAAELSEDPLQQYLLCLKLLAEEMAQLPDIHPGCLVASFAYESQLFDREIHELAKQGLQTWRAMFHDKLVKIEKKYPARVKVDLIQLSDMLSSIIEGAIIVSRTMNDPKILVHQILQYRSYIRLLFSPEVHH